MTTVCAECGAPLPVKPKGIRGPKPKRYCSPACSKAAWNRQAQRGAILLKLYTAHHFDRDRAVSLDVGLAMDRLVARWYEEDIAAGRQPLAADWTETLSRLDTVAK